MNYTSLWTCIIVGSISTISLYSADKALDEVISRKIKDCKDLTKRAVDFIKNNSLDHACYEFSHDKKWRIGEIQVFVFDEGGVCYVFGDDSRYIWHDFQSKKMISQADFISQMLTQGEVRGGLINFTWNNGFMQAYVKNVTKDGTTYIVGAGFYPDSGKYIVQQLITAALDYAATRPLNQLISRINDPNGIFAQGDVYLTLYNAKGKCLAHGKSIELVGQSLLSLESSDGKHPVSDMLAIAKSEEGHGWYEYAAEGGATRRMFVQKFLKDGKLHMIVGGYYPTISEGDVRGLAKRAISYMRTHGSEAAFNAFSQPNGPFALAGISLFVYTVEGIVVADMANPAFRGQNLKGSVDANGTPIARTIIQQAQQYGNGWVGFYLKNAYAMIYIERVKLPDGEFIVGVSYYPIGKPVTVRFMVEKATRFLQQELDSRDALNAFVSGNSEFLRGDVYVEVYTPDGISLAQGYSRTQIYDQFLRHTDEKGTPIIKKIGALAKSGGGWIEYKLNERVRRSYVKYVSKKRIPGKHAPEETRINQKELPPENYIIVSGYYK
jgi:hypothetical protein